MRRTNSLHRKVGKREPLPRVLLVCEGQNTEPGYFQHLRHVEKLPIDLRIEPGGTPKTLVERAKKLRDEAAASRDPNDHYEHVWCVFDVDEHPFLKEARQQARAVGIPIAVSNPCFELWALLHFQEQNAHIERHPVQSACRQHMPGYEKDLPCDVLLSLRHKAIDRAKRLDERHERDQNPGANPSTSVYRLIEMLQSFRGVS